MGHAAGTTLVAIGLMFAFGPVTRSVAQSGSAKVEEHRVTLTPRGEPIPALSIRFWPDERELFDGDAMPLYLRAAILSMEANTSSPDQERTKAFAALWDEEGANDPYNPGSIAKARQWLEKYSSEAIIAELRRAAFRRTVSPVIRVEQYPSAADAFGALLPDVQRMRDLAQLLDLRIRVAIADGNIDQAIDLLRVGFRMGAAVATEELLINQLVGLAIINIMLQDVELLQSHPDCPNLYWALASLPRPIVDIKPSLRTELRNIARLWDPPVGKKLPVDEAGWNSALLETFERTLGLAGGNSNPVGERLTFLAAVTLLQAPATKWLRESGTSEAEIERMFPTERVVRFLQWEARRWIDEQEKWLSLPMLLALPELERTRGSTQARSEASKGRDDQSMGPSLVTTKMFDLLLPAVDLAVFAGLRTQKQLDAQMTIEALRAHAAEHDGQLPESLSELRPLPALPNPVTGAAWDFQPGMPAALSFEFTGSSRPAGPNDTVRKYLIEVRK
jgi:hypothetical protein